MQISKMNKSIRFSTPSRPISPAHFLSSKYLTGKKVFINKPMFKIPQPTRYYEYLNYYDVENGVEKPWNQVNGMFDTIRKRKSWE